MHCRACSAWTAIRPSRPGYGAGRSGAHRYYSQGNPSCSGSILFERGWNYRGGKGTAVTGGVGYDDGGGGGGNGRGGGSGGAEQLRSRYRKEHFEYIRKIIQEHIVYPPRAQLNRWQGTVVVMFCVIQSGNAKDIRIRTSSGYYMLDKHVIETIRKVEPFPKPPVTVELIIPVEYRL